MCAEVAKLVDARDSKSRGLYARVGSIPTFGTNRPRGKIVKRIIFLLITMFLASMSLGALAKNNASDKINEIMDDIDSLNDIIAGHTRLINELKKKLETVKDENKQDKKKILQKLNQVIDSEKAVKARMQNLQKQVQAIKKRAYYKGKKIPVLIPHFNLAVRPEFATNLTDMNSSVNDKMSWVDQRVRLGVEFHPFKVLDAVVTLQDTRRWGDSGTPDGHFNGLDAYNGYIRIHDFGAKGLEFKLGRMQLDFGSGRVIGTDIFALSGRAFDAAIIRYAPNDAVDLTAMASTLRETGMPSGKDRDLYGLYYTGSFLKKRLIADAYGFYLEDGKPEKQLKIGTFGVRLVGEPVKRLFLEAEASIQAGKKEIKNRKHTQFATAYYASVKYDFGGIANPGLGVMFSSASGDANPYDTRDVGYMPLYSSKFAYWGKMDLFDWSGVVDGGFEAHVGYKKYFLAYTGFHAFFMSADGGIINFAGQDRLFPAGKGRTLGYEWDVMLRYRPWDFLYTEFAYGLFAPGAATKAAFKGHSSVAHALYVGLFMNF